MSLKSQMNAKAMPRMIKSTRRYATHVGEVLVTYLKNKLSVPIGISDVSPHKNKRLTERSQEGEYPRKDTGSLQASIDFRVENRGRRIALIFGALNNARLGDKTRRRWIWDQKKQREKSVFINVGPTVYARYLADKKKMARKFAWNAWIDAKRTGALRKQMNRRGVSLDTARIEGNIVFVPNTER